MDELYDLRKDTFELKNLVNNVDHKDILTDMKVRLDNWRIKTNDNIRKSMAYSKKLRK